MMGRATATQTEQQEAAEISARRKWLISGTYATLTLRPRISGRFLFGIGGVWPPFETDIKRQQGDSEGAFS